MKYNEYSIYYTAIVMYLPIYLILHTTWTQGCRYDFGGPRHFFRKNSKSIIKNRKVIPSELFPIEMCTVQMIDTKFSLGFLEWF